MNFPLFRRQQSVVFLDDDPHYLDMLAIVLPQSWNVKLFVRPQDCIRELQQDRACWESDLWTQQEIVRRWRECGTSLVAQILDYWSNSSDRFAMAGVCVVDYAMPGLNGLQALSELAGWPGRRILLTGQADEQIAVRAFNEGLINQFIGKHMPDISRTLLTVIGSLLEQAWPEREQLWRATLSSDQSASLQSPACSHALSQFVGNQFAEHVLIGNPFGVLGVGDDGSVSWIQLETREGLHAAAQLAQLNGVSEGSVAAIERGELLSDIELRQMPGWTHVPSTLRPALRLADGDLFAAHFEIGAQSLPPSLALDGYQRWLSRQKERQVQD